MIFENFRKNQTAEFGCCFVGIGLEHVAVAAARVVGGPPRCRNKGGQKRRCL